MLELAHNERSRIFNLGYYTWVEQQGVPSRLSNGGAPKGSGRELQHAAPAWDMLIDEFNAVAGLEKGS